MKDHTIPVLFDRLVGIQSDTGTAMERDVAKALFDLIREDRYFKYHPEFCGCHDTGDVLQRPVVWALRKGTGDRTIILTGHYDTVDIEPYGAFKPFALHPDQLRAHLCASEHRASLSEEIQRDLANPDWVFGRGVADMKAGLAIHLDLLFTAERPDINLLFLAVPDEENISAGARQAVPLLLLLKQRFSLDYVLSILSEPQFRDAQSNEPYALIQGSMGKILPIVIAKGVLTHAADIFNGLNSGLIIAEMIRQVELSTDFVSEDRGVSTLPPTVLLFKDLKSAYDVSVPEYSVAGFNVLFLKNLAPQAILERFKKVAKLALDEAIGRYHRSFDTMLTKNLVRASSRLQFEPEILTLAQLEERVRQVGEDFAGLKQKLLGFLSPKIRSHEMNLQTASTLYMMALLEAAHLHQPAIVIGVAPPYYPAVTWDLTDDQLRNCIEQLPSFMQQAFGIGVTMQSYFRSMTDMSYLLSDDPCGDREFLHNLTLPPELYDVPVELIAQLQIPTLMIGPAGKDIHQAGERVYWPDVVERIPALFRQIIETI